MDGENCQSCRRDYLCLLLLREPVLRLGHSIQQLVLLLLCDVRLGLRPFGHLVLDLHQGVAGLLHCLWASSQLLVAVEYRIGLEPVTGGNEIKALVIIAACSYSYLMSDCLV